MHIAQHRPVPTRPEQSTIHWQAEPISPRSTMTSNRVHQPLNFSIDDRLSEQHLTRLDLCSKNLKRIEKLPNDINFNVVLLDHNDVTKVEHLDVLTHLIQLSISYNRLIDIRLIGRLRTIQKLNLSHNSLDSIDCLKTLPNLVMLNIAGNNIQNISALNACHSLQSLDVSDNSIRQIEDLSHLTSLKYLNLHKNLIDTLISASRFWPKSIHTLVISDNEIKDLTEIQYLTPFIDLNTLYLHDNPCLFVINDRHGCHQPFDYRPYILNWCLAMHNLDGTFITRKESLKAEWLLSQGKGRSFRPGDHYELVQYLIKVCGTDADERDDLHLSRIMFQQDLYKQNGDSDETFMKTTDTMKDANETLSKDHQTKLQQSLLISESEFVRLSPSSSVSTINEPITPSEHRKASFSNHEQQMRTPSPRYMRSISHNDEPTTEHSSHTRYSDYDNRPIKPLDQNMLQSKLNQYTVNNPSNEESDVSRPRAITNPQQPKRATSHLAYNANRYSPKTTTRGPAVSTAMQVHMRPNTNKNLSTHHQNRAKRHTIAADTFSHRRPAALKAKHEQQVISTEQKNLTDNDDDELQLKSAPVNALLSTQTTTVNRENTFELKKLTTSIETVRSSVLQAYLNLHERFTKTTELQTSALASLWKTFETQNVTHQRETDKLLEENRLLNQRLHDLESRLNIKSCVLHPPLRAHISKRDTKSFFLHWIPNPLNEQRTVLGYRIYVDDVFKGSVDSGKFETVIDYIRDEGEYKIKLRAYNDNGESDDSNIVVARFRRQQSTTPRSDSELSEAKIIYRTHSEHMVDNAIHPSLRQTQSHENLTRSSAEDIKPPIIMSKQRERIEVHQSMTSGGFPLPTQQKTDISTTPDAKKKTSEELISPMTSSPPHSNSSENILNRKPPISPTSSPSRSDRITTNGSCSKVLFTNDSSSSNSTKRSPTRAGIMSRLVRSPHKIKRNNVLLNALPTNPTPSSTEATNPEVESVARSITFQPDFNNNNNHGHLLVQQLPITSIDTLNSMTIPFRSSPL